MSGEVVKTASANDDCQHWVHYQQQNTLIEKKQMQHHDWHSKERKRLPGKSDDSEHKRRHASISSSSSKGPQNSLQSWLSVGQSSSEAEVVAARAFKTGLGVGGGIWSCSHWTSLHWMVDDASQQTAVQPSKVAVTVAPTRFAMRGLPLNEVAVIVHPRLTRPTMMMKQCILRMLMMIWDGSDVMNDVWVSFWSLSNADRRCCG